MDQGFSPTGFSVGNAKQLPSDVVSGVKHMRPLGGSIVAGEELQRGNRAEAGAVAAASAPAGVLGRIRSWFTGLWNLEFAMLIGGGAFAGGAGMARLPRAQAAIKSVALAPFAALRSPIARLFHIPSTYMHEVAQNSAAAGGKATGWAASATRNATVLEARANRMDARVAQAAKPLVSGGGRMVDRLSGTTAGKKLSEGLNWAATKRLARVSAHHDAVMESVAGAFKAEAPGFLSNVGRSVNNGFRWVLRKPPAIIKGTGEEVSEHLLPIMRQFESVRGFGGAEKVARLEGVQGELRTLMQTSTLPPAVRKQATTVMGELTKAVGSAQAMHRYQSAVGGPLKALVKAGVETAGRVPLFSAIVGVGVAAGLGATIMASRAESKQAKQAYKELLADVGGDANSPFMQAVQRAYHKQGYMHTAKAGLNVVSGLAEGAFMTMPAIDGMKAGMALMGAQTVPGIVATLIPGNPILDAHTKLKNADRGVLTLSPEQREYCNLQLIAANENVAAKGGMYNQLAKQVAHEMVKRKMSATDVVRVLANDNAFTAFAAEVAQKQKAAATLASEPAKAAPASDSEVANAMTVPEASQAVAKPASTANDNHATAVANDNGGASAAAAHVPALAASSAEQRYMATERPSFKVAANDAVAHGKLAAAERMVG